MPSLQPLGNLNNVIGQIGPGVVANSATAQALPPATSVFPGPTLMLESATPSIRTGTMNVIGGSERQLSGLKPVVPLRKRGQSFRETKKITTSVDTEGRRHLNQ